ncbi:33930_t:CDS:2, partial [Gigaspora margarita]
MTTKDYDKKYPLPEDFLVLAAKIKDTCIGKIESITYNEDGSISVERNVASLETNGRQIRNQYEDYRIKSTYDLKESTVPKKKRTKSMYVEDPRAEILNQIFNEVGNDKNDEEKWEHINAKFHEVFGHSEVLKSPSDETEKRKYLSWIFALRYWELSNRFPVAHWVYKAEKTFGSIDFLHENMPKPTPSNKRRITSSGLSTVKKFKNNLADIYD